MIKDVEQVLEDLYWDIREGVQIDSSRVVNKIREAMSPVMDKAKKWDRVQEIAKGHCKACPFDPCSGIVINSPCDVFEDTIDALK